MNSNNSTGFSGISDLFSKIDLDALRQQVGQNQSQIQEQTKSKRTLYQPKIKLPRFNIPQGYWWIAGILLVIWLASNDDNKHQQHRNASTSYQTKVDSEKYSQTEIMPPIGTDNALTYSQIRFCLSQKVRIEEIQGDLNRSSDYEIEMFNSMIENYNSRCGSFRYPDGAVETVQKQVIANHARLISEALSTLKSWRGRE